MRPAAGASPKPFRCAGARPRISRREPAPRPICRLSSQHFLEYSRIFRHCVVGFNFEASFLVGRLPANLVQDWMVWVRDSRAES